MKSDCSAAVALLSAVLLLIACDRPAAEHPRSASPVATVASNPLLDTVRAHLQTTNPAIAEVAILDIRAPFFDSPKRALLAWGVRKDKQFRGNLADQLFGVFVVNDSLTRVLRTLEILPTPRWLDFDMRIDRVTSDSVYLVGKGDTYGDGPITRAYAW